MHRISETAAIAIVVAVLFLGLQYTASITPQRNPENPLRVTVPEAPATDTPGEDMIPPVTTVALTGVAGLSGWYTSPVQISLSASDDSSGVSETAYSFDKYMWPDYYGTIYVSSEGSTIIYYCSRDFAGNTESIHNVTINIDMSSPVTEVSLDGNLGLEGWYFSCVTVTLSSEDAVSGIAYTEYSIDGADWVVYNGPFVVSQDGQHQLTFRSADIAGNVESTQTESVRVDTNAPITMASLDGILGPGGWYRSDVTLTLAASDSASGVADTQYSYDGISWSTYNGPITLSGTGVHIVLFCSSDHAGNTELSRFEAVQIDMISPVTTAAIEGNLPPAGWYVSDVTVTLSATDEISGVAYSECSIDGGAWTVYSGPLTITKDGNHEIAFRSMDLAGNVEDAHSVTFGIDRSPPTTVAILDGKLGLNDWYTSAVTMTLVPTDSYSGVADTEYSFDQTTWSTYEYPLTFYNDGVFTIYFYSADNVGSTEDMQSITVSIDMTRPVTTVELKWNSGTKQLVPF